MKSGDRAIIAMAITALLWVIYAFVYDVSLAFPTGAGVLYYVSLFVTCISLLVVYDDLW